MIIMPDDHQPSPIERFLDWEVAYRLLKAGEQQLRNEPPQSTQERLNDMSIDPRNIVKGIAFGGAFLSVIIIPIL